MKKASLYGVVNSNRNFEDPYYWGKNQFNSSFPLALACFMRNSKIKANYLELNKNHEISVQEINFDKVFNTTSPSEDLFFSFEAQYKPFEKFLHDELKPIDLVIKSKNQNHYLRPIEIKLTTLPDSTTATKNESEYGAELVIRSPTMRYMALSMAESCEKFFPKIKNIFQDTCHSIRDWNNQHEILAHKSEILKALEDFLSKYQKYQRPLLMQPVWKTVGKSAQLAENCLDIFVWSDFALTRLFMDAAIANTSNKITRQQRAAFRLSRFLYEVSRDGKVYQQSIYDGMTYDTLNDKEFAVSGTVTHKYMKCKRLTTPVIKKGQIKNIILGGGQNFLSPERRFDAIIFFSSDLFK
ncbi:MAG: HindVP family restriction endonuclease [Deltaproteobacteria bacterium]|nr:MAG: HindVP family restriction endonuclease [Deltaproteobacteria bacterium]